MNTTLVTVANNQRLTIDLGGFQFVFVGNSTGTVTVNVPNEIVNRLFEQGVITSAGLTAAQQTAAVYP